MGLLQGPREGAVSYGRGTPVLPSWVRSQSPKGSGPLWKWSAGFSRCFSSSLPTSTLLKGDQLTKFSPFAFEGNRAPVQTS